MNVCIKINHSLAPCQRAIYNAWMVVASTGSSLLSRIAAAAEEALEQLTTAIFRCYEKAAAFIMPRSRHSYYSSEEIAALDGFLGRLETNPSLVEWSREELSLFLNLLCRYPAIAIDKLTPEELELLDALHQRYCATFTWIHENAERTPGWCRGVHVIAFEKLEEKPIASLLAKIEKLEELLTSQQPVDAADKLTIQEFQLLHRCGLLLQLFDEPSATKLQLFFDQFCRYQPGDCPKVCVYDTNKERIVREASRTTRCNRFLGRCESLLSRYTVTNITGYSSDSDRFFLTALNPHGSYSYFYEKRPFLPSFSLFDINAEFLGRLLTTDEERQLFTSHFFRHFQTLIMREEGSEELSPIVPVTLWGMVTRVAAAAGIRRGSVTIPEELSLNTGEERSMLCSTFAAICIIEATCLAYRDCNVEPPASLTFFGLDHDESMEALFPRRLVAAFTAAGLFSPSPLLTNVLQL